MKTTFFIKLKNTFNFLLFTVLTIFLVSSCEKSNNIESNDNISKFDSYKIIGKYHNENLDYIYKKMVV